MHKFDLKIEEGQTRNLQVIEIYKKRLDPFPKKLALEVFSILLQFRELNMLNSVIPAYSFPFI